ncbi:bifunctional lytic transglycosylase/C40 family peptidase [Streptomyces sp. NPDC088360]|uniref:C40 family peptidase n=1 Tax=Streptomyces sp. NPDC088360 TaxID=3154515 RepID=UPI00344E5537
MRKVIAIGTSLIGLVLLLIMAGVVIIAAVLGAELPGMEGGGTAGGLSKQVPAEFRPWINKAVRDCKHKQLTGPLLAAQLNQESGFNTSRELRSPAGAQGPAQFMPGTWPTWGRDTDGNGKADPFDVPDAVVAQGRMMCSLIGEAKASGIRYDIQALALAGYNAGWYAVEKNGGIPPYPETQNYVHVILTSMKNFAAPRGGGALEVVGHTEAANALRKAATQLGEPYSYGGGSPKGPSTGFCDGTNGFDRQSGTCAASNTKGWDCSSLVQYAFWPKARMPRTAQAQYNATSHNAVAKSRLRQGDLLFWSNGTGIYHVAIYAGDGNVLHAPRTGKNVEVVPLEDAMPKSEYHGATRP